MAEIKISQMPLVTKPLPSDVFMVVQNSSNKKVTLATLLDNMNSPVTFNKNLQNMTFVMNGTQPNLFYLDSQKNAIGILTNNPLDANLHVFGDIRVGGYTSIDRTIYQVTVGANDSGGIGFKTVTIRVTPSTPNTNDSIFGIYNANDIIFIGGLNISELNGYKVIGNDTQYTFKYNIPNNISTSGLNTTPTAAYCKKVTWKSGLFKSSIEQILHNSDSGTKAISASFSISGLNISGTSYFSLSLTGAMGQEKYIYLRSVVNSTDKAIIDNVNGLGFNRIQFIKPGDSVSLTYDGEKWICLGVNGAQISTV